MNKKLLLTIIAIIVVIILTTLIIIKYKKNDTSNETSINKNIGTFVDERDNKTYNWVEIGEQIWMSENLAFKPSEGDYWAYDNNESNVAIYGYLYSWKLAQNIAPSGWHLPSQVEWKKLTDYLGENNKAYNKLLQSEIKYWGDPNNANGESGFIALPSGYFDQRDNSFNSIGYLTMFHSTTEYIGNKESAMGLILNKNFKEATIEGRPKALALPVRLIKD